MIHAHKGFDSEAFFNALSATVQAKKLTWKDVSAATGVSPSTLTRMAQGRNPDASSLAALAAWAGINPADFVEMPKKKSQPEALAAISALLRADPRLSAESAKALESIVRAAYSSMAEDGKGK
jgi:transcriptional regulator with XRE-family HTH domain